LPAAGSSNRYWEKASNNASAALMASSFVGAGTMGRVGTLSWNNPVLGSVA
jgi:hypothetical protein